MGETDTIEHSPGPWRLSRFNPNMIGRGLDYIPPGKNSNFKAVAVVSDEKDIPLILAAPDLLKAVKDSIGKIDRVLKYSLQKGAASFLWGVKLDLQQVINKAEGKS